MTTWHRPLILLALAMAALSAVAVVGLIIDPRLVTGVPLWAKPLKFSLSVLLYGVTLAWMLGMLKRFRRLAWSLGTIAAVALLIEMIIIVGAAVADDTSHFNVSTPLHATLWAIMAVSISVVWGATIVVAILLFRAKLGDEARTFAIRAGVVIAVIGMGLAFLMTGPKGDQISNYTGIIGAHTVGLADGGPGLPILGWSTIGGDLRIPHFIGMHALQVIPLAAILLEALATRLPTFAAPRVRRAVLRVVASLYAGILAVLTLQALSGQSIVSPDAAIVTVSVALFAAASVIIAVLVVRARGARTRRVASPLPRQDIRA